ncbi:hypothetical protein EDB85DRAFT_2139863 [Lactarius pseudohatsudake]|nr:hypothetical protein EDB85DRAFT_2139863 [Lactarius pseudohatsudake]
MLSAQQAYKPRPVYLHPINANITANIISITIGGGGMWRWYVLAVRVCGWPAVQAGDPVAAEGQAALAPFTHGVRAAGRHVEFARRATGDAEEDKHGKQEAQLRYAETFSRTTCNV